MAIVYSFLLFLFTIGSNVDHDFHFSKGMLRYHMEEQAWQLSLHVYIDDFEDAMEIEGYDSLYFCTQKENPQAEEFISLYLDQVLQLNVDGQLINFELLGKEMADDKLGMWIYAESVNHEIPQKVVLDNQLLLKLYDDQQNMITVKVGKKEQYALFNYKERTQDLNF